MPTHKWFTSSFERCSFLFGSDLLPAVYTPGGSIERTAIWDTRPSDVPSFIGSNGKAYKLSGWTAYRSTPDEHQRWQTEGLNAVLHTRRVYGLRMPADREDEFAERTGIKLPMLVREGRRGSVVALFRISPDGGSSGFLTGLKPRQLAEPRGTHNRTINNTLDPVEFLGEGASVLVCGKAANGSVVSMTGLQQMTVPTAHLDGLERFWHDLGNAYWPIGDGHSPAPLIVDARERLGHFVFQQALAQMPPRAAMFLHWLANNGKLVGFDGTTAQVRCPWHPYIKTKSTHLPAKFDMLTGEMVCTHPTCQRLGRTRIDFEKQYAHRFGMQLL